MIPRCDTGPASQRVDPVVTKAVRKCGVEWPLIASRSVKSAPRHVIFDADDEVPGELVVAANRATDSSIGSVGARHGPSSEGTAVRRDAVVPRRGATHNTDVTAGPRPYRHWRWQSLHGQREVRRVCSGKRQCAKHDCSGD